MWAAKLTVAALVLERRQLVQGSSISDFPVNPEIHRRRPLKEVVSQGNPDCC